MGERNHMTGNLEEKVLTPAPGGTLPEPISVQVSPRPPQVS